MDEPRTIDPTTLSPEERARRPDIAGTAVQLGGREWLLDQYIPPAGGVWDRLYDLNVLRGRYDAYDLIGAAFVLLLRNYELTRDEALSLVLAADLDDLVEPVEAALFGGRKENWTYSKWVRASLLLSGVDPDTAPPELIRPMMDILERTGRTVPEGEFISSQVAGAKRHKLLNFGKDGR